jgi:glycosyltransferase involved in cell wall biosynthesis
MGQRGTAAGNPAGSRTIRVLHIITRMIRGGAQENTLHSILRLRERGFESEILCGASDGKEGDLVSVCRENRVPVILLPELVRDPDPPRDLAALLKICLHLRRNRYDVIHTHTSKAGFIGRLAARLAASPAVVHTPHGHIFHSYYGFFTTRFYILLERLVSHFTKKIVTLTDREAREHLELGIGTPSQFATVRSGVDLERFRRARRRRDELLDQWKIPPGTPAVGYVGRLAPVKGAQFLLEAIPGILADCEPPPFFVFAGDGELRETLAERASAVGVQASVLFTGVLPDTSLLYPALDILVVPSLNEGMGRVIVEAMASGTAVVATAVGGIPELVRHRSTGLLVPPKNPEAIGSAVLELLRNGPLRERLSADARQFIDPEYDVSEMANHLERIYLSVLD